MDKPECQCIPKILADMAPEYHYSNCPQSTTYQPTTEVAELRARITALESDAEVDAQLIRDRDKRIAELEADHRCQKYCDSELGLSLAYRCTSFSGHIGECEPFPLIDVNTGRVSLPSSPPVRCSDGKHTCECGFHIDHCVAPPTRQPLREMPEDVGRLVRAVNSFLSATEKHNPDLLPVTRGHLTMSVAAVERHYSPRGGEGEEP